MDPTVHSALTVAGAAAIVASIVEATEFPFDLIKDPIISNRAKRAYVFLIAFALVALEVYQRLGYHSNGDLLGLATLASTIAGSAILGWHLLNGKLKTETLVTIQGRSTSFENPMTAVGGLPLEEALVDKHLPGALKPEDVVTRTNGAAT